MKAPKRNEKGSDQKGEKASYKTGSDDNDQSDDDFSFAGYAFASSALANPALMTSYHLLMNSVIYDSRCSQTLIFDKNRFIDEIESANDLIKTSNNHMKIAKYETMLINARLKDKDVSLRFYRTAYISTSTITLVSQSKLANQRFDRDSYTKTLIQMKTSKQICEIQNRYEVQLLKFNLVSDKMTNSIQLSKNIMIKVTS
jgi:hypothetical protein